MVDEHKWVAAIPLENGQKSEEDQLKAPPETDNAILAPSDDLLAQAEAERKQAEENRLKAEKLANQAKAEAIFANAKANNAKREEAELIAEQANREREEAQKEEKDIRARTQAVRDQQETLRREKMETDAKTVTTTTTTPTNGGQVEKTTVVTQPTNGKPETIATATAEARPRTNWSWLLAILAMVLLALLLCGGVGWASGRLPGSPFAAVPTKESVVEKDPALAAAPTVQTQPNAAVTPSLGTSPQGQGQQGLLSDQVTGTVPMTWTVPAPGNLDSMSKTVVELAPEGEWFHRVYNTRLFHSPDWDGADSWYVTLNLGPNSGGSWTSFGNPGQVIYRGESNNLNWCVGFLTTSQYKSQFLAGAADIPVAVNVRITPNTNVTVVGQSGTKTQATSDGGDITVILPDNGITTICTAYTTAAPTHESHLWWGPYDRSVNINTIDAR